MSLCQVFSHHQNHSGDRCTALHTQNTEILISILGIFVVLFSVIHFQIFLS